MNLDELGTYLQTRRSHLRPTDVGLTPGPRRRVPGLRRDEVASLAGVSVDYYKELEHGRGAQPSEQMLGALARALRLGRDERDHLFHLAGRPVLPQHEPTARVQGQLLALLDLLEDTPAQIITDLHEPLLQNRLAVALIGRQTSDTGPGESFIYRWFTHPAARARYLPEDHDHHSRVFVADLRASLGRRGGDAEVTALVADLRRRSPEFAALWDSGDVAVRRLDRKRMVHPSLGHLEVDCHRIFSEDGRQRLVWFTAPPGSPTSDQLELLPAVMTSGHLDGERSPSPR